MSELFEDDDDKVTVSEDDLLDGAEADILESDEIGAEDQQSLDIDARRRLENLLEEKRLRDELEDFFDYE